ncbi:MAG TPA: YbaB/EbfC family nucleoid-associated protein [Anaerolineales bacterium]|nr:YbaB/EbfC family nucleoid-associated protein [Anaerolineales bacterium]
MENMLGQLREMQKKLEETRKQLAEETIEASSGRGAVRIVMSGTQECRQVLLTAEAIQKHDPEKLGELVRLAVNQAIKDSQLLAARKLGPIAGPLAGLGKGM